jgi:hypothetical protein
MKINYSSLQVGAWVRVYFDDVGARDGIIMEKEPNEIKIFEPMEKCTHWVEKSRILARGPCVTTPRFE